MMKGSLWPMVVLGVLSVPVFAGDPPPPPFADAASQVIPAPPADKAQIVFLEPVNKIQGFFPVAIFELDGDARTLLAVTGSMTRTVLNFEPGPHRLMSTNLLTKVHFLDATVEAGKRYYVLVRFLYNEGFQLRPIRTTAVSDFNMVGADWKEWIANTPRLVEKTAEGDAQFARERPVKRIDKTYAKAVVAWNKKTAAEKSELTLTPADAAPL